MIDIIETIKSSLVYFVGLLWALILDGLLVKKGNGYVKIRLLDHTFQKPFKTFLFYLCEIIILSAIATLSSRTLIPWLLIHYPYSTIIISILVGYARFRKDIYGEWGLW